MSKILRPDPYGTLSEDATLTISRLLPGSAERVWSYLTQSDLRRQWMAAGEMKLAAGAAFKLTWRNSELSDPPGERPADFGEEHSMESRVVECDPPRRLTFTWSNSGDVTFELEPRGDMTLLTVTHRRLASSNMMRSVGPGWHAHLDMLAARMAGVIPATPFWNHWSALKKEYEARIPA